MAVNVASVWLRSGHGHDHGHEHSHGHSHGHDHDDDAREFTTPTGTMALSVFEDDHPPVFRVTAVQGTLPSASTLTVTTIRPDRSTQHFTFASHGGYLQSVEEIPEPHAFTVDLLLGGEEHSFAFEEHGKHAHSGAAHRDNNMRAAIVHVLADAAVSVLVIVGLGLAWAFGWLWMDPLAGMIGAGVIAAWSYGLVRDTGAILLDMNPDRELTAKLRQAVESEGDQLADLHVWRLGPGHLGAILSIVSRSGRTAGFYRSKLTRFRSLSHVTVEIH